jgi:hypothetical protein
VRRWWRAHAPNLARATAALGVQSGYALLVASAFLPSGSVCGHDIAPLEPGDSCLLEPDVPHGATALEDSVLIDALAPPREDF